MGKLVSFTITGNAWSCLWDIGASDTGVSVAAGCCRTPGNAGNRF